MKTFFNSGVMSFLIFGLLVCSGCASGLGRDTNNMLYKVTSPEPDWIRNGEPVEFEGDLWYPGDTVDILLDTEVIPVGEYRGIQIFVQTVDVRPYSRVYTKFDKNKFRGFETKSENDQSKKAF